MHKLLQIQIKKCFGKNHEISTLPPEVQKLLAMIDMTYGEYDSDYRTLEHILETSSNELNSANESLRTSHELLQNVTESVNDLIFYKDLEFKYIGCNRSFADFFGRSEAEFVGHEDFELYPYEYASLFREMDTLMLNEMKPRTNKEWVKNHAGEDVLLLTTKAPLINSSGDVFGLVGVARDITKEQKLENEFKAQEAILIQQARFAAMGEMISNIAHQWRQPLNALSLLLQNIIFSYKTGRLDETMIQHVNEKGLLLTNTMSTTIDDFRNFFKPNKEKERFFISTQIRTTLSMLQASLTTNLIETHTDLEENLQINGYANEFSQVVLNILNNAKDALIEHQSGRRMIHIRGYRCDNAVCIEIADNAGGIPSNVIEKVFDPYYTTKDEGKGTGIGLYMSKVIIEHNMNGRLSVHNDADGAVFKILIRDLE